MTELDAPQDTPDFGFSVEHDDTTSQDASSPDSDEAASLRTLGISETDLGDLLEGYVMLGDGAEIVFGRRYGSTLVDVHRYPDASPPPYRAFIQDKIRERFVPQNDRTAPVPSGVTPEALDVRAVAAALGPG